MFTKNAISGLALKPQAINTTNILGETIVEPWLLGRSLMFQLIGAAMAATDALTIIVQARRVGTTTWDTVQENGSATDLAFTATKLVDTGQLEDGTVVGSLNVGRLTEGTLGNLPPVSSVQYHYDAIRLNAVNAVAQNVIVGATYVITDLYTMPVADATFEDDLFFKQTPHTAA